MPSYEIDKYPGALPPLVNVPVGWQGDRPQTEILTLVELARYLNPHATNVNSAHEPPIQRAYLELARQAYANAMRWLAASGVADRPKWEEPPENNEEAERLLTELIRWLESYAVTDTKTLAISESDRPKEILNGWVEITFALDLKNTEAIHRRIRARHKSNPSPIRFGGPGILPQVERRELIRWWNS